MESKYVKSSNLISNKNQTNTCEEMVVWL